MLSVMKGRLARRYEAEVLYRARGRCQRCGKTIKTDNITLVVVRKRPESSEDADNPRQLCGRSAKSATPERDRILFAQCTLVHDPDSNAAEGRQFGETVGISFELLEETSRSDAPASSKPAKRGGAEAVECMP